MNDYIISIDEKRVEIDLAYRQPEVGKTDYHILQEKIWEPEADDMSTWEVLRRPNTSALAS